VVATVLEANVSPTLLIADTRYPYVVAPLEPIFVTLTVGAERLSIGPVVPVNLCSTETLAILFSF
jgi:hypothetical protein